MIPLNFYRDDEYVYYNNPNGITKKMTIADFESAISGGGGDNNIFSVNFSYTESFELVCDKSYNDILSAISSGKPILAVRNTENGSQNGLWFTSFLTTDFEIHFIFTTLVDLENEEITYSYIIMSNDGSLTEHAYYTSLTLDD